MNYTPFLVLLMLYGCMSEPMQELDGQGVLNVAAYINCIAQGAELAKVGLVVEEAAFGD